MRMRSNMAESDQISRKKMRFSSPSGIAATAQILARRKSQVSVQNNLTFRTGSAAIRAENTFLADFGQCQSSLSEKIETKFPRAYSRVTIKDLRVKRFFSPSSFSNDWDFRRNSEDKSKEKTKESVYGYLNSNVFMDGSKIKVEDSGALRGDEEERSQKTPPDAETFRNQPKAAEDGAHRIDQEIDGYRGKAFSGSAEKKSDNYLGSKPVFNRCSREKLFKNPGSFSYRRLLPYLMEVEEDAVSASQCPISEKPSDDVHLSLNLHGKEENGKIVTAESKHGLQSADTVFNKSSASTSPLNRSIESSSNRKSVQEQSYRRKLFRTPGSVNYRRLLPYFTDIQDDNPCVPKIGNHPEPQKSIDDNTHVIPSVTDSAGAQEPVTLTVIEDICSNSDLVIEPSEQVSESLFDPEKQLETQIKHVIADFEKSLDVPQEAPGLEMPLSSLASSRCSSDVDASVPNNSSVDTLVEQINSNVETRTGEEKAETDRNAEGFLLESSAALGTPPSSSPLKERALEFSWNQMQDAKEMVLDLVGEISYLKDMLEKSAPANDTVPCTMQVEEASRRASEAAELAESRLHQMSDDLQVHCRIPTEHEARVKSLNYTHEKTKQSMNLE